ncbi:hypothetical protein [Achromobacter xylosoxidans]|uniref:hypothetical protein n=1 Tax=Alcaligenes xylosoxydans xylosoxydans TaxID=85698 RepID=UPI00071CC9C2|nr:hypothetical protein [Achromobacter xylosoxidans]EBY9794328.1 hypothetical protein [Salmonella enterica subsp. enterica serovar Minnesota]QKQ55920.1 hypothetical protein FOC83_24515 [Achromobacter xylosoxidans]QPR94923.1 hypothetical protein I6G72_30900 [Achromobacter xylosoxidans]UON38865.1 hypothetical protein IUJ48_22010 [Achromobacter xylosoxidans]
MNTFEAIRDDQCPDIQQRQPTARKDDARKWKRRLAKALHIMSICIAGGGFPCADDCIDFAGND